MAVHTCGFACALFVAEITDRKPFGIFFVVMTPQAHGPTIVSFVTVINIVIRRPARTLDQSKKARCLFEKNLLPFAPGVGGIEIFWPGMDHIGVGSGVFGDALDPVAALTGDRFLFL